MVILGNGIMKNENLVCRKLNENDVYLIKDAVKWQTHKYGYPVNFGEVEKEYIAELKNYEKQRYIIGCFENDNCVGLNLHAAWENFPFWSFASLIIKPDENIQGLMTEKQINVLASLVQYNCNIGEQNGRFDWFVVTQDSTLMRRTRHFKIMEDIYLRYEGIDIDVVKPGEPFKWHYLKKLIANRPFKNPLVIKMFYLKNHIRPNSWHNYNKNYTI